MQTTPASEPTHPSPILDVPRTFASNLAPLGILLGTYSDEILTAFAAGSFAPHVPACPTLAYIARVTAAELARREALS